VKTVFPKTTLVSKPWARWMKPPLPGLARASCLALSNAPTCAQPNEIVQTDGKVAATPENAKNSKHHAARVTWLKSGADAIHKM